MGRITQDDEKWATLINGVTAADLMRAAAGRSCQEFDALVNMVEAFAAAMPKPGDRYRLTEPVERFPQVPAIPVGWEGTVIEASRDLVVLRMDLYMGPAWHEWDNALQWSDADDEAYADRTGEDDWDRPDARYAFMRDAELVGGEHDGAAE